MSEQLSLLAPPEHPHQTTHRLCLECPIDTESPRWWCVPHDGPCGRPCLGGVDVPQILAMTEQEVEAHHFKKCLHCKETET